MKKVITSLIISFQIISTPVHAVFGVGDIVSDPGSYAYYADQINEAKKQYDSMMESVDLAKKNLDKINDVKNTIYSASTSLINSDNLIKNTLNKVVDDAEPGSLQKFFKFKEGKGKKTIWDITDSTDMLHEVYIDVSKIEPEKYDAKTAAARKEYKKQAVDAIYYNIIKDDKKVHEREKERKKRVDNLIKKIQNSSQLLDIQKIQTFLLAELVALTQDIHKTVYMLAQTEALVKYTGRKMQADNKDDDKQNKPDALEKRLQDARNKGYRAGEIFDKGRMPGMEDR